MTANHSPIKINKLVSSQESARNATFGKIELQYELLLEENNRLEASLKQISSLNMIKKSYSQTNIRKLYTAGHRRRHIRGISKTNEKSARLKGTLKKLQFRSPKYRPGHTNFLPSNPTGVPITGPRANLDRIVYSNWNRKHRFQPEKITPGPSDYNPNYNNPNEQYVYVSRVQPYGTREVVDENNIREKKKIVDLFQRALAFPTSSPIKTTRSSY